MSGNLLERREICRRLCCDEGRPYNTDMAYSTLSDQVKKLTNPQRSDAFFRQFRDAVREGKIEAADLPGRFTLPKEYRRRGAEGTYTRDVKNMVVNVTPAYEKWFAGVDEELNTRVRRTAAPKASLETVESGEVDFAAMVEETRRKLQGSYTKGQTLGQSRKGKTATVAKPRTRRTTKS